MFNLFYGEQVCSILFKTLAAPTLLKYYEKRIILLGYLYYYKINYYLHLFFKYNIF
jgi:hypothetical protein